MGLWMNVRAAKLGPGAIGHAQGTKFAVNTAIEAANFVAVVCIEGASFVPKHHAVPGVFEGSGRIGEGQGTER